MSEEQRAKGAIGQRAKPPQVRDSELGAANSEVAIQLPRINGTPEEVEQGLAKLVLSLIEFLRQVLERQAVRRMDGGDLTPEDIERMGLTLMRLEQKVVELTEQFGLTPDDLNIDLGPVGKLL